LGNIGVLALLALAATLEAGGDALVRSGLHAPILPTRIGLMAAGALVLFAYGICVNLPPWDFGRLLGVSSTCSPSASNLACRSMWAAR
jgi:hypothetical protein